jgi:hypothetical protein
LNQQWGTLVKLWNKHLYRFLLFFIFLRNNWPIALKSGPEHNKNKGNNLTEFLVSGTRPTTICKRGLGYFFGLSWARVFFLERMNMLGGIMREKKRGKFQV